MTEPDRQFHALRVAREIASQPEGRKFRVSVMEDPEGWPVMTYHPYPSISAGGGLTRNDAIRLLSAMLLDITEMPDYAR
jgi:hypothetical protein